MSTELWNTLASGKETTPEHRAPVAAWPRPAALTLSGASADAAMATGGKKERHPMRDMRLDLGAQCREVLAEQRAHHQRQDDQLDKLTRGRGAAVSGEPR